MNYIITNKILSTIEHQSFQGISNKMSKIITLGHPVEIIEIVYSSHLLRIAPKNKMVQIIILNLFLCFLSLLTTWACLLLKDRISLYLNFFKLFNFSRSLQGFGVSLLPLCLEILELFIIDFFPSHVFVVLFEASDRFML